MGSSRASTPAGRRRRASQRTRGARDGNAGHPSKPKAPAKRAAPKGGKAASKPRTAASKPRRAAPKSRKPESGRRKTAATRPRRSAREAAAGLLRPRTVAVALAVLATLAAGYQLWLRNSPLVAVEQVSVEGVVFERDPVIAALDEAATEMTTLNVDEEALRAAVAGFPTVAGVTADADFPHGLAITVNERPPVILARDGERSLPVAGDGTVLAGVDVGEAKLPAVPVTDLPAQGKVGGEALEIARVMGAAPEELRPLVEGVSGAGAEGLEVVLRGEIPLYFGGGERAGEKWAAAAAVLADPEIDTLTYVDVRVPDRPAVGGAAPPVTEATTETAP